MSAANLTQVAGTHYRSDYQHWDLVVDMALGYFEGQITKYVTRHQKKHGEQDLRKALHFTRKLEEVVNDGRTYHSVSVFPPRAVRDYCDKNNLPELDSRIIENTVFWRTVVDLRHIQQLLVAALNHYYPEGAADRSYVKQE